MNHYVVTATLAAICGATAIVGGYEPSDRWEVTATQGAVGATGTPITITWSILPDGTPIREEDGTPSSLVARLDEIYQETPASSDVTERSWFPVFERAFDRWTQLGGVTFVYEQHDDGAEHGEVVEGDGMHFAGELGVRGDIRIGGAPIDGNGGSVAYNYLPNVADMVIDTEDPYFENLTNDSRRLFNTLMHEAGHALGLGHVRSTGAHFIMEANIPLAVAGPQFDDVLGLQHLYGDPWEKAGGGIGNNEPLAASTVGILAAGESISIGTSATDDVKVGLEDVDFVSISSAADTDFYRFTTTAPVVLDAELTPAGPTYAVGPAGGAESQFDASAANDLALSLWDADGESLLTSRDDTGVGGVERLAGLRLPLAGDYLLQITGSGDQTQMYRLDLAARQLVAGDYDSDGIVDTIDYVMWRDALGSTGFGMAADGNGDSVVDRADYLIFKTQFATSYASNAEAVATTVPEPASSAVTMIAAAVFWGRRSSAPTGRWRTRSLSPNLEFPRRISGMHIGTANLLTEQNS